MTNSRIHKASMAALFGALCLSLAFPASAKTVSDLPNTFSIGRNSFGELCSARLKQDGQDSTVTEKYFGRSYLITCRNATSSLTVGSIRIVSDKAEYASPIEAALKCGESRNVSVKGFQTADARQCFDQQLSSRAVVIRAVKRGRLFVGSAASKLVGPLEQAMAVVSGGLDPANVSQQVVQPSFALNELQSLASDDSSPSGEIEFNPETALKQGIRLSQQSLNYDASRLLNDAISRMGDSDTSRLRGQLELEAALADSNIRFFKTADAHFQKARTLLASDDDLLVRRKLSTYEVLHALNQRQFRRALAMLDTLANDRPVSANPLQDQTLLSVLNQPSRSGGASSLGAIAAEDLAPLQQNIVDTVLNWARSVALLGVGDFGGASQRLDDARRSFSVVKTSRIDLTQSLWLESRIERQAGRISAQRKDWPTAIAAFDRAIATLILSQQRNPSGSNSDLTAARLERADLVARSGVDKAAVIATYSAALSGVIDSGSASSIDPNLIEPYLNILAEGTAGSSDAANVENFFKAVQAIGEPAIARQVAQLQSVVTADPKLGAAFQEREDLARELSGLRAEIQQKSAGQPQGVAELEKRRTDLQARLQTLEESLTGDSRYEQTNSIAASIADVRALLRDGEVYYKLTTFKRSAYATAISRDATMIFRLKGDAGVLTTRAGVLRKSIEGSDINSDRLPEFNVALASNLFKDMTGPATSMIKGAKRIVVDPSGPLQTLPFGVLVNDDESVKRYQSNKGSGRFYADVSFVARTAEISNALSPRSFVVARKQPPSAAPRPFIGFGGHVAPNGVALAAVRSYNTRAGCVVNATSLGRSYRAVESLDTADLKLAAQALGDANAPLITGADFTDERVLSQSDIAKFSVLHFSTHGFREGQWLVCAKSPPALLTSLAADGSDGVLSFDEIARLKIDANLVFLAACDTSADIRSEELALVSGLEEAGGSLDGLVRSFLAANARAVVATYWEANSDAAIRLSQRFYEQGRTATIGESLQQGQLLLMSNAATSHPFFWGPYFVVGDASKRMIAGEAKPAIVAASSAVTKPSGETR